MALGVGRVAAGGGAVPGAGRDHLVVAGAGVRRLGRRSGIIFGVVPAQRAGRLDPVVALRTE